MMATLLSSAWAARVLAQGLGSFTQADNPPDDELVEDGAGHVGDRSGAGEPAYDGGVGTYPADAQSAPVALAHGSDV